MCVMHLPWPGIMSNHSIITKWGGGVSECMIYHENLRVPAKRPVRDERTPPSSQPPMDATLIPTQMHTEINIPWVLPKYCNSGFSRA